MVHPKGGTLMNAIGFDFVLDGHPEAKAFHTGSRFALGALLERCPDHAFCGHATPAYTVAIRSWG
jgi:hypothetical protein